VIDGFDYVVRLKEGKTDPRHFGTRTDAICARSHLFEKPGTEFWYIPYVEEKLRTAYRKFSSAKPSTGLGAIYCAIERGMTELTLIGFDLLLRPNEVSGKYTDLKRTGFTAHDAKSEAAFLKELPVKITELRPDVEVL
jgi:hypothetical protein